MLFRSGSLRQPAERRSHPRVGGGEPADSARAGGDAGGEFFQIFWDGGGSGASRVESRELRASKCGVCAPFAQRPYSLTNPQKEKRPCEPLFFFASANCVSGLDAFNVLCLPAFGAFYDVELNLLSLLQAAETIRLDGGEVNKHVLAILTADKPIALGIVKPLYCSCFHDVA